MTAEFNHEQIAKTIECPNDISLGSETIRNLLSFFGEGYWNYLMDRNQPTRNYFGVGRALEDTRHSATIEARWRENQKLLTLIGLESQVTTIRREADDFLRDYLKERGPMESQDFFDGGPGITR